MLYSGLMIFIRYEDNSYCFICYIQENIIFYSTHAIFDKKLFPKYTNSYIKEHKLYDKLLDKISPEIELLTPNSFRKDGPALVSIPHTSIPSIQNNSPTHSSLLSLSYKSVSISPILGSKKPIVEIKKDDNVDSDVEMQLLSSQQLLQSTLQTPQKGPKLRRSKYQTQILFREGNIYGKQEHLTNIL